MKTTPINANPASVAEEVYPLVRNQNNELCIRIAASEGGTFTARSYEQLIQGPLEALAMLLPASNELNHELAIELSVLASDLAMRLRQAFGLSAKVE